jgi:NADPH-dependent ferric siderophore reductase
VTGGPGDPAGGRRGPRLALDAYVRDAGWLGRSMVRVVLGGGGLGRFPGPGFADAYVKLLFLDPAVAATTPDGPLDLDAMRAAHGPDAARLRTYTVRSWDAGRHELTLDVVVHGEAGIAGPWAARAEPGDRVFLLGPGGAYTPDPAADVHLFAGDASALPAIAVALEALPATARGVALVEVDGPEDELALTRPPGVELTWLHLRGAPVGSLLVPEFRSLGVADGRVEAFVHGEAGFVRELRRHVRSVWQVPPESFSVSGYWRLGMDDERWRASKAEWFRT